MRLKSAGGGPASNQPSDTEKFSPASPNRMSISPGSVRTTAPLNVPVVMSAPAFIDVSGRKPVIGILDKPGENVALRMLGRTIIDRAAGMGDLERRAAGGIDHAFVELWAEHIAAIAEAV